MNKKKIKLADWKKILTKMAVSLGLLMVVILVLINTITQYPDVAVPLAITLLFLLSGYWIYLCVSDKNKKYVDLQEFKKCYPTYNEEEVERVLRTNNFTDEEVKQAISYFFDAGESSNVKVDNTFNPTTKLVTNDGFGIYIDSESERFAIIQNNKVCDYVSIADVNSYEVKFIDRPAGTSAAALGAITGNSTLYALGMANTISGNKIIYGVYIEIVLNDLNAENIKVILSNKEMSSTSKQYTEIENVVNKISSFFNKALSKSTPSSANQSPLDEIKKLKELLDMDAITKEEYEKKKKELLK